MVAYRLTRSGRLAVVYGVVSEIQFGDIGATMTQVSRMMNLRPSTYVMDCLKELEDGGVVRQVVKNRKCGGITREWFIVRPSEVEERRKK